MMDALVILLVVALVFCGAPLYVIFGALSVWLFARLPDTPVSGAANDMFSEKFADSPLLVTIPLFTFAGVVLAASGAPHRLVKISRALFGWVPGGLAIVCLVASAIFTTFTGGSGVTIVAIGGLLFPALIQEKYDKRFALGLVTTGGSLGVLFPPSVPVIIYGVVAGVDIEGLFIAAFVPGLLVVAALALYSSAIGVRHRLERSPFDLRSAARALWQGKWEAALLPVLVAGLATGMLRIHEAAAFTALYVLLVELFVYRDITVRDVPRIAIDCVVLVGAILVILATAIGLTAYLIQANVPQSMLESMEALISSRWAFLIALNVFLIVVGMLMDIFSAIVVVVPLIVPIANHFGINPYHLAAIFLLNLEIGYLTPPLGLNLFISGFRFNRSLPEVYRAVVPFITILIITLGLVTFVPGLSTWSSRLETPIDLGESTEMLPEPAQTVAPSEGGGETLEDLMKGDDSPIDLGGAPKEGETLEDLLNQGKQGETLDDLMKQGSEGETLEDLQNQGKQGETLDDLSKEAPPTGAAGAAP